MELKIGDRLALLNQVLPQQASMVDMLIRECIAKAVSLTTEDIMASGLSELPGGSVKWDTKLAGKDFAFSAVELAFLAKQVARLDAANQITPLSLDVCRMIQDAKKEST